MATRRITRGQAIKKYCKLICCAGDIKSWKECIAYHCFLWRFRLGRETLGNTQSFKKKASSPSKTPKITKSQERYGQKNNQKEGVDKQCNNNIS